MCGIGKGKNDSLSHFDTDGDTAPNSWNEGNFDGNIDITDFNFLASNFVPDGYEASAVSETTVFLLSLLVVILLRSMSLVPQLR